jgi:hypothetical protein
LYNAFKRVSQGYAAAARAALFHDTAARVYRINVERVLGEGRAIAAGQVDIALQSR